MFDSTTLSLNSEMDQDTFLVSSKIANLSMDHLLAIVRKIKNKKGDKRTIEGVSTCKP